MSIAKEIEKFINEKKGTVEFDITEDYYFQVYFNKYETDDEVVTRLNKEKKINEEWKERRRREYLKLKEEFEGK